MAYQASFPAGAVPAGNVSPSPPCSGKLKIFFGYAAGVGKTYAMLEAALRARDAGIDVVCGCIDPDVPPATQALLKGLGSCLSKFPATKARLRNLIYQSVF